LVEPTDNLPAQAAGMVPILVLEAAAGMVPGLVVENRFVQNSASLVLEETRRHNID